MRAWLIEEQTGIRALKLVERDMPTLGENDVLVRMTAPGVVPFDSAVINDENEASFPAPALPVQPGNQGAGIVEHPGKSSFKKGDRVMFGSFAYGFMRPGSWAEYVAVDMKEAALIPASVTNGAASQAVVAYPTAYLALKEAGFKAGNTVLVPAIGGSVGNAGYQLARALGASNVLSTAGSTEKAEAARKAGFENIIDLSKESLFDGVNRLNDGRGVDIVIDSLGGPVLADAVKCAGRYGTVITLGFSAGRTTTLAQADLILNRVRLQGLGAYTSPSEDWQEAWSTFARLADEGTLRPLFDRSFPFEQAPDALRYLIEKRPFGAVALSL